MIFHAISHLFHILISLFASTTLTTWYVATRVVTIVEIEAVTGAAPIMGSVLSVAAVTATIAASGEEVAFFCSFN